MDRAFAHGRTSDWLSVFIGRCQIVAGCDIAVARAVLQQNVRSLIADLPSTLAIRERLVARNHLTTVLARTIRTAGIERHPDVLANFFSWATSDIAGLEWRDDAARFVTACAEALELCVGVSAMANVSDSRIAAALRFIESNYKDPDLSLKHVASHAGLSVWHTARLIKWHTGVKFKTHLHQTRIKAAQTLLADRTHGLKEIAAAVGYTTPSQFSAHFRRLAGVTPTEFRATLPTGRNVLGVRAFR